MNEAMIKFKGRLGMKQYMPMKPITRGIKVWECAEASSGFVCNFQVYTGKKKDGMAKHNLGYRVVSDLTRNFECQTSRRPAGGWHLLQLNNKSEQERLS